MSEFLRNLERVSLFILSSTALGSPDYVGTWHYCWSPLVDVGLEFPELMWYCLIMYSLPLDATQVYPVAAPRTGQGVPRNTLELKKKKKNSSTFKPKKKIKKW